MEKQELYWNETSLMEPKRHRVEKLATAAILELVKIREIQLERELQDRYLVIFFSGIAFATLACLLGFSLH